MNKIKVAHMITRLDPGGSTYNTLETVARLDKKRYQVSLIAGKAGPLDENIKQFILKNEINCTFINELRREIHPVLDCIAFWQLFNICRSEKFSIVHTHSSKAGILGRWAARFSKTPHIIHTPHGHIFHGYFNRFITGLFIILERWTAMFTERIITLTKKGIEDHLACRIAPEEKFIAIHSGIDIDKFKQKFENPAVNKKLWGIDENDFVFGTVARLDPIKGNEYLIRAFAQVAKKHEPLKLLLVGEGSERAFLEGLITESDLKDKVIFTGFQEDVASFIGLMDVFVLSSINEGMGRVILEAMALSKPVIASNTGGIPELVKDNQTGLLFEPMKTDALASKMEMCLQDSGMRQIMAKAGFDSLDKNFSITKMVDAIDQLYREVM